MEAETYADKRSQLAQKMDRWIKALVDVANLKGNDIKGRLETEFIEEIVKDIHHKLHVHLRRVGPQLIGMQNHINFVTSWLKDGSSHTADILTISGMGGIGKTYLAKHVYGLYSHEFHKSSCIEDISRVCDGKFNGLLDLQKQLCNDISKTSSIKVHDALVYTSKIENIVARKRVFLTLDDINTLDQLDALLGSKGFHPGSKIIITTKERRLIERCALFKTDIKPKHTELLLQGLHETESWKLLCLHAFKCKYPKTGYEGVFYKLVKYCQGHPLALVVLGKFLYDRDVTYWEGCIEGLKKETDSHVNNVLRMSFNSLQSKNDKDLFKYIACFFVEIDRDVAETILQACNINIRSGIPNLLDRFLLTIGGKNKLKMHQLVQEMGRFEVHQESHDKPLKRSLLWCHEESFRVLKQKKGKGNLVGLALDMRMLEKEMLGASYKLKTDALSMMDNLMLLQLNYVHMNGSYENFPLELRALERLIVRNCTGLLEVCESIEQCVELSLIDLSYCKELKNLPRSIGMLKKAMVGVEEKVLRSLGWSNLLHNKRNGGNNPRKSRMQMLYEFGIFSTTYDTEEMPSWFIHRSAGPSISFTIPSSSPNNLLKGINFCFLQTRRVLYERPLILLDHFPVTPMITVSNITKNRMWIYERLWDRYFVDPKCWVVLSHWMFGMNEMEPGDHVTITVTARRNELTKECGVSLVYEDDGEKKDEEEGVLGYYKSWNHIIGGDLSPFQTTTGQFILRNQQFVTCGIVLFPYHRKFVPDGPDIQV
ncbi:unnamed protein product [Lactuca saligna]|uniref:ADP-ribosyl cyclase/cyclic ADP-ribose hydrolase n=1 Tax=Lactuca saligna TaxID=75948 RepID=A0AA35VIL1_LACSI|nr:unnamed protein product [Lactuca saligna]